MSFSPASTVVLEAARADRPKRGRPILWPVFAWRVVAPVPAARKLNVFQSPVLGLTRTGLTDPAEIASRLALDPRLITFVQGELRANGWLDARNTLTRAGEHVLSVDDAEPVVEDTAGWVFADPETGALWPWFLAGALPEADVDYGSRGEPRRRSSKGDGPGQRLFVVNVPRVVPRKPTAVEVNDAVRKHTAAAVRAGRADASGQDRVARVSFVTDEPKPYFLLLGIAADDDGGWCVEGAFSDAGAVALTSAVTRRRAEDPALSEIVRSALGNPDRDGNAAELVRRAEFDVETALTSAIRHFEEDFTRLVQLQRAWAESRAPRAPEDKLDDVFVKAQVAVERVLLTALGRWPVSGPLPFADEQTLKALVAEVARSLGFEAPLPKTLLGVRAGKLQWAFQGGGGLRPLLILNVLAARGCDDHPLRAAAGSTPRLLHEVNQLADARDASAHELRARKKRRAPVDRRADAERAVATVLSLARALLIRPR